MRSNYKILGDYIEECVEKNEENLIQDLRGISNKKYFQKAKTNLNGIDLTTYRIVRTGQFAFNRATTRNGEKISIALRKGKDCIVSPSYRIFETKNEKILNSDYLMMWFRRPEFDRYARFKSHGSAHEFFDFDEMCEVLLPIPSIQKQQEIVNEYNNIVKRIKLHEELNQKLEKAAQTLYKHWFVDFEFPITKEYAEAFGKPKLEGNPYKSSGGEMVYNEELEREVPEGWQVKSLSEIAEVTMGQSPSGESYNYRGEGEIFYQGRTDFGFRIPEVRMFTSQPKRFAKGGDILMSVRAPVGDLNISIEDCCIGRGLASIRSKESSYIFYLMLNFKSLFDADKGTGTIFSSINKDELYDLRVLYCKEISQKFHSVCKILDNKIIMVSKQNQYLTRLEAILLSRMSNVKEEELI